MILTWEFVFSKLSQRRSVLVNLPPEVGALEKRVSNFLLYAGKRDFTLRPTLTWKRK